jgi:hypothetical protein
VFQKVNASGAILKEFKNEVCVNIYGYVNRFLYLLFNFRILKEAL